MFNPELNTWQDLAYPSDRVSYRKLISINNKLLLVGGKEISLQATSSPSVLQFDLINNSWSKLFDIDFKPGYIEAVAVNFSEI